MDLIDHIRTTFIKVKALKIFLRNFFKNIKNCTFFEK